jgi:hypothetical protein
MAENFEAPASDPMLLDDLDAFLRRAAFDVDDLPAAQQLVDRLMQVRHADSWQPIDTVPRDGSDVLLFEPFDPEDFSAGGNVWRDSWDADSPGGPDWDVAADSSPTHWRPDLAPPATPKTTAGTVHPDCAWPKCDCKWPGLDNECRAAKEAV